MLARAAASSQRFEAAVEMNAPQPVRCPTCWQSPVGCVCSIVARIDNRVPVTILQHPREARHAFGTLGLLAASLERLDVRCGVTHAPVVGTLLWPGDDATPIEAAAAPEHLIAIDGTWSGARVILRDNPWLAALPKIVLTPSTPGRYRTRREKTPRGMATVEAVASALVHFEPELAPGVSTLFAAFEAREARMVAHQASPVARMRKRRRPSAERVALARDDAAIGAALRVGGEAVAWAVRRGPAELSLRLDADVSAERWARCGLADAEVVSADEAAARLGAFLADVPALFVWRAAPFERLALDVPIYDLKTIARRRGVPDAPMPHALGARLDRSEALRAQLRTA
ncbi:MAG: tRNA-uridine aminocarboxypropyltransferase [Deltaproteobacteria bacterium]